MREFLSTRVPWGRPAVPEIPVPPFADAEARGRFTRLLQLHVALVDEGTSLAAKILGAALTTRGPVSPQLTALELEAAMATFFPAPWTPAVFAETLGRFHSHAPRALSDGRWSWDVDPVFTASPREPQGWVIERNERGGISTQELESDGDLVLLWMEHFHLWHPFPYAWRVDEADMRSLAPAARAAREVHAHDAALPYLANWRAEREAALDDSA
ncbi:hypothetical protein K3N28_19815 [Glycomyces sp. TRM65418]|uniref:hypothetical protein n=1 Tax=Glycomyces sp. TRM65418 TaxID=2867006 RepID=UPI001CE53E9B|nr:hypothetical protein [Glycomyces sp. TRM65418]MCC3765311.1 hypothetical protein [Glycomyces sp. TRM65418]QZD54929.1 hypothetical protein K3N28_19720 [Glycomyces sp. TRM65418]